MISEEAKTAIDALSKDELRLEVNKANRSRFQGDKFAYVQSRLQRLEEAAQTDQHRAELAATTEANQIARQANAISKKAWRISVLSAVIAIVAVVVSMWARK